MHIICTATARNGTVTHHLALAATGAMAYRQLKPLLSPGSTIATASVPEYMRRNGTVPEILIDYKGTRQRAERIVPKDLLALGRTAAANPENFWEHHDDGRTL